MKAAAQRPAWRRMRWGRSRLWVLDDPRRSVCASAYVEPGAVTGWWYWVAMPLGRPPSGGQATTRADAMRAAEAELKKGIE